MWCLPAHLSLSYLTHWNLPYCFWSISPLYNMKQILFSLPMKSSVSWHSSEEPKTLQFSNKLEGCWFLHSVPWNESLITNPEVICFLANVGETNDHSLHQQGILQFIFPSWNPAHFFFRHTVFLLHNNIWFHMLKMCAHQSQNFKFSSLLLL